MIKAVQVSLKAKEIEIKRSKALKAAISTRDEAALI